MYFRLDEVLNSSQVILKHVNEGDVDIIKIWSEVERLLVLYTVQIKDVKADGVEIFSEHNNKSLHLLKKIVNQTTLHPDLPSLLIRTIKEVSKVKTVPLKKYNKFSVNVRETFSKGVNSLLIKLMEKCNKTALVVPQYLAKYMQGIKIERQKACFNWQGKLSKAILFIFSIQANAPFHCETCERN